MKIITGKTQSDHVNSEDDRALHAGTFGTGSYVLNIGTKLNATIESSNTIRLDCGELVHNGTHARIPYGTYDEANIDNGTTGYMRKDLIVARYEKNGGFETVSIVTIKGIPSLSDPIAPDYEHGNILEGAEISDMPLYEVLLNGVNIESITALFKVFTGLDDIYKKSELLDRVYPIGAIYMSVNNINPGTLLGGVWEEWGSGRIPIGVDKAQDEFNTVEKIGGEKQHNHEITVNQTTLTIEQIPAHSHTTTAPPQLATAGYAEEALGASANLGSREINSGSTGGGQPHGHTAVSANKSSLPPYITCFMWKRTK